MKPAPTLRPAADRLITILEVKELTARSRATIYRGMDQGVFPLPAERRGCFVRWKLSDVEKFIGSMGRAPEAAA